MGCTVNKQLLPLKIHYFFKYGGISFFLLLPVLCRGKGVPESAVGLIWTITPIITCGTNLLNSTIADAFKIYRGMFLGGLMVLTVSFLSIFLVPNIHTPGHRQINVTFNPLDACFTNDSSLNIVGASDWHIFQDCNSLSNSSEEINCDLQCSYMSGEDNLNRTFHWPEYLNSSSKFGQWGLYSICDQGNHTAVIKMEAISAENIPTQCFEILNNVSCLSSCQHPEADPPLTLAELFQIPVFWLMVLLLILIYAGNSTSTTMADTICFYILGSDRHKYGRQRMWGSVGWGLVGLVSGALVDIFSKGKDNFDYTPALIVASLFLGINFLVALKIPFNLPDKEKLKASRVGKAVCYPKMLLFLSMVVIVGINMGLIWTFLFIIVEDVAKLWDPNFPYIKLLQGLMLGTSCFLGEVPSLFMSSIIVKKIGHIRTFVLSLAGYSFRMFLYFTVVNPWYFIPIDLSHGLSFGLFYPNMLSYANRMSPKGAQATIQGLVKSLFVLGVSLGGFIGGFLVPGVGGQMAYFYVAQFDGGFAVVFALLQFLIYKLESRDGRGAYAITEEAEALDSGAPKKTGLKIDLDVAGQGSMCDLQVITPYTAMTPDDSDVQPVNGTSNRIRRKTLE